MAKEGDLDGAVGERIAEMRRQKGLTQDDLLALMEASGFAWTRTTLSRIESGQRALKAAELFAVAEALGIRADELNPGTGSLTFAVQRQRARYRNAMSAAAKADEAVQAEKGSLVALALVNELRSGRTAFVVNGTPLQLLKAFAAGLDQQNAASEVVLEAIGINHDDFQTALNRRKKTGLLGVALRDPLGVKEPDPSETRDRVNKMLNDILRRMLGEVYPDLQFVGGGTGPLSVEGLNIEEA